MKVSRKWRRAKPRLWEAMLREHQGDEEFSDLYCVRAFFLLYYGTPPTEAIPRWVEVILKGQGPEGGFADPRRRLYRVQGHPIRIFSPPSHTTAFCFAVLGRIWVAVENKQSSKQ